MKSNRLIIVYSIFCVNARENEPRHYPFNEDAIKSIEESLAVAATDASVKESQIGGSWIITDFQKKSLWKLIVLQGIE